MKQKPAVNTKYVALFAAACVAASGMAKACEELARSIIGKGRGKDDYESAVKELSALEQASTDGNKHTVRRYTAEALAIVAKVGRKATVPTVAAERTEKAQEARKGLGIKARGVKSKKKAKTEKVAKPANFEEAYRAMLRLQAGRASLISWAKAEGYDLTFAMREVSSMVSKPADAKPEVTKAGAKTLAKAMQAAAAKAAKKGNGAAPTA